MQNRQEHAKTKASTSIMRDPRRSTKNEAEAEQADKDEEGGPYDGLAVNGSTIMWAAAAKQQDLYSCGKK